MYYLNKLVGYAVTPVGMAFVMVFLAIVSDHFKCRSIRLAKIGRGMMFAAAIWIWLWSAPLMIFFTGAMLEREFLINGKVPALENYPDAEVVLLLGGGMGAEEQLGSHSEMWNGADRVWKAAQLYKAGKVSKIYATGGQVEMSTGRLLADFGVPREAVVFDENPRNTEEEAKAAAKLTEKKVLLVTSAWHMKRALLMFKLYAPGLEVIPVPCDFENTMVTMRSGIMTSLLPDLETLKRNSVAFHECLGIIGYSCRSAFRDAPVSTGIPEKKAAVLTKH